MQRHKSKRHVNAANARWRRDAAQAERDAGIPDMPMPVDVREAIQLDLRPAGGDLWVIEPVPGKIAWRAKSHRGEVRRAAFKTLLHDLADALPKTLGERNLM